MPLSRLDFQRYIIEALLAWMEDQNYTPYMIVDVDDATQVPREYLNDDKSITLCVYSEAVNRFNLTDEAMSFQARFGDQVEDIFIPLGRIKAIFPKEESTLVSLFEVRETPKSIFRPATSSDTDDDIPTFTKL